MQHMLLVIELTNFVGLNHKLIEQTGHIQGQKLAPINLKIVQCSCKLLTNWLGVLPNASQHILYLVSTSKPRQHDLQYMLVEPYIL